MARSVAGLLAGGVATGLFLIAAGQSPAHGDDGKPVVAGSFNVKVNVGKSAFPDGFKTQPGIRTYTFGSGCRLGSAQVHADPDHATRRDRDQLADDDDRRGRVGLLREAGLHRHRDRRRQDPGRRRPHHRDEADADGHDRARRRHLRDRDARHHRQQPRGERPGTRQQLHDPAEQQPLCGGALDVDGRRWCRSACRPPTTSPVPMRLGDDTAPTKGTIPAFELPQTAGRPRAPRRWPAGADHRSREPWSLRPRRSARSGIGYRRTSCWWPSSAC